MPTLLKIGQDYYICKNDKQAAAVVTALAGAVKLHREYRSRRDLFYPDREFQCEVGLVTVHRDQMFESEPSPELLQIEDKRS